MEAVDLVAGFCKQLSFAGLDAESGTQLSAIGSQLAGSC
jgi:hypothetical protein